MQTIGKYHVVRVLGHGGMGTVYEAVDPIIKRKVALKTMIPELAETAELRARFLREAQAAGGLRHRNIVTVYDLGEDKGRPYIAMEFIEGTDLEKIIQMREPTTAEWKIDVLAQVCEGLSYAHRNGIVHRDVKPGNIRVTTEGDVKIMDFGIAHLQSSNLTKSGLVLGTVHYMAPEQIDGKKADHRADVFSVGAIAYELFSYRKPFDGESITGVMYKIMHEQADFDMLTPTAYSPGLERIIMKALARSIDERYQSLDGMRDDLVALVRETAPRLSEAPAEEEAESESLRTRVEREMAEIGAEMEAARAAGHLQRAVSLCQRLLDINPDDEALREVEAEIVSAIHEKEVEQLSSQALAYAADGDIELAMKIAGRIERIVPGSPAYLELRRYLEDEARRLSADALTAVAQEHLAEGELEEAHAAAEQALEVDPQRAVAREIRDRAAEILSRRAGARAAEPVTEAVSEPQAEPAALPAPEPAPATAPEPPQAAPLPAPEPARPARPRPQPGAQSARFDAMLSQIVSDTRAPARRPPPANVAAPEAEAAAPPFEGRRSEVEALTTAALDHFVQNDHGKARKAVEKALALEPQNRKARELLKILGALG